MLNFLKIFKSILTVLFLKIWYWTWFLGSGCHSLLNWWLIGCAGVELCICVPILQGSHSSLWNGCTPVSSCHGFIGVWDPYLWGELQYTQCYTPAVLLGLGGSYLVVTVYKRVFITLCCWELNDPLVLVILGTFIQINLQLPVLFAEE